MKKNHFLCLLCVSLSEERKQFGSESETGSSVQTLFPQAAKTSTYHLFQCSKTTSWQVSVLFVSYKTMMLRVKAVKLSFENVP